MKKHEYAFGRNPNPPRIRGNDDAVEAEMHQLEQEWALEEAAETAAIQAQERAEEERRMRHKFLRDQPETGPQPTDNVDMRGRLTDPRSLLVYMAAGNATMTVQSKSGTRFTYRFTRPNDQHEQRGVIGGQGNRDRAPIWVKVLTGQDNEADYQFLGTIWVGSNAAWDFRTSAKTSPRLLDAPSMRGIKWIVGCINAGKLDTMMAQAEFWHEGRCGRCGRKLTVPSSIASGFGPECIGKM